MFVIRKPKNLNRLFAMLLAITYLRKRVRNVEEQRFKYVLRIDERTGGPDPEDFGVIYLDRKTNKEYLIDDLVGDDFKAVHSIKEFERRPAFDRSLTKKEFQQLLIDEKLILNDAPIDIQEAIIEQFRVQCQKKGWEFHDQRKRENGGNGSRVALKKTNSLS